MHDFLEHNYAPSPAPARLKRPQDWLGPSETHQQTESSWWVCFSVAHHYHVLQPSVAIYILS